MREGSKNHTCQNAFLGSWSPSVLDIFWRHEFLFIMSVKYFENLCCTSWITSRDKENLELQNCRKQHWVWLDIGRARMQNMITPLFSQFAAIGVRKLVARGIQIERQNGQNGASWVCQTGYFWGEVVNFMFFARLNANCRAVQRETILNVRTLLYIMKV